MWEQLTRRQFLKWMGGSAIGISYGAFIAACQRAAELTPGAAQTVPGVAANGTPAPSAQKIVEGVPVTTNDDFYTVAYSTSRPSVPADWKLRIVGLVDNPLELSLDQIKAMPAVTEMRTLECISNPVGGDLIGNAVWNGVLLKDLLEQARVKNAGAHLRLESLDKFFTGIPLELGMHPHALLAYEMNGEPLPREHGAPLRCLWPGRYGMKQPKWLQTITVLDKSSIGYWEQQGWTNDAFINPNSRIDSPKDLDVIADKTLTLSGVAFSGEAGIAKIEVSWDNTETWFEAELARGPSPFVWTIWKWTGVALAPGRHTLYARVTDKAGRAQTKPQKVRLLDGTFPNGTDEMHSIILDFRA